MKKLGITRLRSYLPAIEIVQFCPENLIIIISAKGFDIKSCDLLQQKVCFQIRSYWEHEKQSISSRR